MARPRRYATKVEPSTVPAPGAWRDLGDDPEQLAPRLALAARWAAHGSGATPPERAGRAPADWLDALDRWLEELDPGRRMFAWQLVAQRTGIDPVLSRSQ